MTDPAHRVAPNRLFLVFLLSGQKVARQSLPPVDTAETAELPADRAVLHGDRVEERQAAATLGGVSPAQTQCYQGGITKPGIRALDPPAVPGGPIY